MKYSFLLLLLCMLICSCKKSSTAEQFLQCSNPEHFDSTTISAKLVGSWKLIKQRYGANFKIVVPEENIRVMFNANATFKLWKNSSVISKGNWKLQKLSSDLWGLDLTDEKYCLDGYILFCNNQVVFSNNYVDGNDNLFEKTN